MSKIILKLLKIHVHGLFRKSQFHSVSNFLKIGNSLCYTLGNSIPNAWLNFIYLDEFLKVLLKLFDLKLKSNDSIDLHLQFPSIWYVTWHPSEKTESMNNETLCVRFKAISQPSSTKVTLEISDTKSLVMVVIYSVDSFDFIISILLI